MYPISLNPSIYDAEASAALAALEEALNIPTSRFSNDLWTLLDNQNVARNLLQTAVCSSQKINITFASRASAWSEGPRLPHTVSGKVKVHWIPSHKSIQGNIKQIARPKKP